MIEQVLLSGLLMALVCFGVWAFLLASGWEEATARNAIFTLLVLMQFYHVMNCRSETTSVFRIPIKNNPMLIGGMILAFVVHVLATEIPFMQSLLRTESLSIQYWLQFAAIGVIVTLVIELYKRITRPVA